MYVTWGTGGRDDMCSGSHVRRGIHGECVKGIRHDTSCELYSYLSSDKQKGSQVPVYV